MAFYAPYEEIRRARAKALRDDLMSGADRISGGVAAFGTNQKAEEKLARDLEDRKIKQERDAAEEARAAAAEERARAAEKRAAARAAEEAANNTILRKKREADIKREDEAQARVLREKKIDDVVERTRAAMGKGISPDELAAAAGEVGLTPEELDQRVLESEEKRRVLRRKSTLDEQKTQSEITKNEALAKKAARVPAPKPVDPAKVRRAALEEKLLNAHIKKLGQDSAGEDLNAPTTQTVNKAQEQRRVLGAVKRLNQTIRDLERQFPNINDYVGTVDSLLGKGASFFGLSSQEAEQVKSTIQQAFNEYKVAVTGAASSDKEMTSLLDTVPNMSDEWSTILGKAQASDNIASGKLRDIDAVLAAKDTRAYDPDFGVGEVDALPDAP